MKILMICTEKLPVPPIRGGAIQTYIEGVCSILSKHHELTILGTTDPSLADDETVDNIRYVRFPGGLIEHYLEGITPFLSTHSFDVIHIFNRPRLVQAVREHAPNARLVLSMHNDMFTPQKIDSQEAEAAIDQLDKIVTVSDYVGRTISDSFPQATPKLKTIYSGVDLNRFAPPDSREGIRMRQAIRQEHNLSDKKVILFAGRLSANKGADILVQAMPELAEKHPDIALVLVGSKWFSVNDVSDYVAYVRALAARLSIPIINTGFVPPDEIQNWFAAADIFVCPSQWQEPLARVHYEAMASGLPIITTARGGNPEVIIPNENGLIVETPENSQEFVEHLSTLLAKPQLAKNMGLYGRRLAEEKYTWNRVATDILDVWNEIETKIQNNIPVEQTLMEEEQGTKEAQEPIAEESILGEELVDDQTNAVLTDVQLYVRNNEQKKSLHKKKMSKKEKLRSMLLFELSNSNSLLDSLLENVQQQMVQNQTDDIQLIIQKVVKEAEQFVNQETTSQLSDLSNTLMQPVNDITTAKLFTDIIAMRKRKKKSS